MVATDHTDLALLQLTGGSFAAGSIPVMASAQRELKPLDPVMSLGFPAGQKLLEGTKASLSPTQGEIRKVESTVQLSMPTIPGNSGGPVFDAQGQVIGVTTRSFGESVSVCIPIDKVRALLLHLKQSL